MFSSVGFMMSGKVQEDFTKLARPGLFLVYTTVAVLDVIINIKVLLSILVQFLLKNLFSLFIN